MYEYDILEKELGQPVPDAWHTLENDINVEEPETKVTLRIDTSLAKFYCVTGSGYQARVSRTLARWAHMKITKHLRLEERMLEDLAKWIKRDRKADPR